METPQLAAGSLDGVVGSLNRAQIDALEALAWAERNFGSLCTGRTCRRSVVLSLVNLKLARSVGMVALCDADGFQFDPPREREGFQLTSAGKVELAIHTSNPEGLRTRHLVEGTQHPLVGRSE